MYTPASRARFRISSKSSAYISILSRVSFAAAPKMGERERTLVRLFAVIRAAEHGV